MLPIWPIVIGVSFESNNRSDSNSSERREAAEANLRIALFLRQVRWLNLVLVAAVLFAGIVSIGALALTQPPRGQARDVIPFVLVAGVGQLGAFYVIFRGLVAMRSFAGESDALAPVRDEWRTQLRRTRTPMLAAGALASAIGLVFTGASVITITGTGLGIAFILQLVVLLSVATRNRADN